MAAQPDLLADNFDEGLATGVAAETVRAVRAGMARSKFSPEMQQGHSFGPPHRCGATRNATHFPWDSRIFSDAPLISETNVFNLTNHL